MVMPNGKRRWIAWPAVLAAASYSLVCTAGGSIDLDSDTTLDYKLTVGYALAVRTESPSQHLINGPVDPFQLYVLPPTQAGQPFQFGGFAHTGLPTTINFDDGDRNFKKWSLVNDRASGLLELSLTHNQYGLVVSGDGFYDQVYRQTNDNDSPGTVNKSGPNDEFTQATRHYDGERARLLDAYGYADWNLFGDVNLNVRVGKQVVAWGESLFFPAISGAQGTADATKAFVPGAEIKEILLPTDQIAIQMSLTPSITLLSYYKFQFKPNEIFPVGDYFSPADAVGPGATFVYGSANPVGQGGNCTGLLQNITVVGVAVQPIITPALESTICSTVLAPIGAAGSAPPFIYATRAPDINPTRWGQYGVGLKDQLFSSFNFGVYYLHYNDPNPTVQLNYGYAPFTTNPNVTTQIVNQEVPTTYNVKYFGGISLFGASFSTVAGPFNIGGDAVFRDRAGMADAAYISGVLSPVYTRGKEGSFQASAIYVNNPGFFYDDLAWVTEAGYHRLFELDKLDSIPGQVMVGNGKQPFYSINAVGLQTLVIPTRHNIFQGWDLSTPFTASALVKGTPELAGAFGALYGQGDVRFGAQVMFTYLQNLQFGVGYNIYLGDTTRDIGHSTIRANPYADRDFATFNVKYNI